MHELTTEEIKEMVQKFVKQKICQRAGADGVNIHCAHGYLVNQFLSPDTNARTDEYGGSFENRIRFGIEVIEGIRKAVGPDFILGARIPGREWVTNAMTEEECVEFARRMEKAGCDYLDVSAGLNMSQAKVIETEVYPQGSKLDYALPIKAAVSIPVGTNGMLNPQFAMIWSEKEKWILYWWPERWFATPIGLSKRGQSDKSDLHILQWRMHGKSAIGLSLSCALNPVAVVNAFG